MANLTCTTPLKVCAMRAVRLDPSGAILPGASSLYTKTPVLLAYSPNVPDRERLEQTDGCGNTCVLYLGPPRAVDSVTLRADFCDLDAEWVEMLAGGSIITESYDTIGYLAPTDSTVNEDGVALEVWSLAWAGRQRALIGGAPAYYRHVFPKTTWTVGEITFSNGVNVIPLSGQAETNENFGTGLAADPFPADVADSLYGWALVDSIPDVECGYQNVAA
jgi:hypothetical protein